jgi:hypothetical protein
MAAPHSPSAERPSSWTRSKQLQIFFRPLAQYRADRERPHQSTPAIPSVSFGVGPFSRAAHQPIEVTEGMRGQTLKPPSTQACQIVASSMS